eukprot:gene5163-7897_t
MEFKDRLKAARRHAKLNQGELAAKAGITQTSISDLERGKSKATAHVVKIADACGVSAKWLSDEIGPMLAPGSTSSSGESNVSPAAKPTKSFRYPVVSWVAAGAWAEAVEPYPAGISDTYEFSEYDSKGPAFWLTVKGDSMTAPAGQSITEGTLILVDTEAEVSPGKLVVAKLPDSNEATFKKLVSDGGRLFLKPLNPSYPIEAVDENCRIVGVVVQALQKLQGLKRFIATNSEGVPQYTATYEAGSRCQGGAEDVQSSDLRDCPLCAETIKKAAVKCEHCGAEIEPARAPKLKNGWVASTACRDEEEQRRTIEAIASTGLPVVPMIGLAVGAGPFETKEEAERAVITMRDGHRLFSEIVYRDSLVEVSRRDDESPEAWRQVIQDIGDTAGISIEHLDDGAVRIGWREYCDS